MSHRYQIRIDKQHFELEVPCITGRELLALVGKVPENTRLIQRLHGGQARPVPPDDVVDLTDPGVERFMTLPLDQTEGGVHAPTV